jgi:DNA/RNA endonuclease YhcR with UshA esterase domain
MKFVISFICLLPAVTHASPIRIFHENKQEEARVVREIFLQQYAIPEDLIATQEVLSCEGLKGKGKLDLCLKNNGDLLVVSVDRGFINESLKIFQAP